MRFSLGVVVFDGSRRELLRGGEPVRLSPKAFRLLEVLVTKAPAAVSKEELSEALWPDVFVQEANLKNLVSEVRQALCEDARNPRFLRTVYGFGYALRLEPRGGSVSRFRVTHLAREFELVFGENVLGREGEAGIVVPHKSVSRRHARLVVSGDVVSLEDLGSKNGTWMKGRRIEAPVELADGDEFRLGSTTLVLHVASGSTETDVKE